MTNKSGANVLSCFVIIGFGMKTDLSTGRVLNLDKTYTRLIKPAFDSVGIDCFRAIDVNRSGSIDELMYYWIYHADMVVVDISTLNANVFYELGVRHAQKPNTTIIISESELLKKLPFDINHTVIHSYEHLGEDIASEEAERFVGHLSGLVQSIIDDPIDRDSPVYTYLRGMKPPEYKSLEDRLKEAESRASGVSGEEDIKEQSLALLVDQAESAKNKADYPTAIALFKTALEQNPSDVFLMQRLALVTYKSKQPDVLSSLNAAGEILEGAKPLITTDPETLGLCGAINKRLYEETGQMDYFDQSLWFYERGFYVKQDYYNGINVAYLYTIRSTLREGVFDAIVDYGHANLIRKKVAGICQGLIDSERFASRGDKEWVYQTLAQAYLGMDKEGEAEKLMGAIQGLSKGAFDMDTFKEQNQKLLEAMKEFKDKLPSSLQDVDGLSEATAVQEPEITQAPAQSAGNTAVSSTGNAITITLPGSVEKQARAIKINCEVTYHE